MGIWLDTERPYAANNFENYVDVYVIHNVQIGSGAHPAS
jgi:hypothetical protein